MQPSVQILRLLAFAGAVFATACLHKAPTRPSDRPTLDSLINALRQQRVTVSRLGTESGDAFPFFSAQTTRLVLNGEDVHVFEYPTETIATSEALTVAPAGTPIGTTQVS